MYFFSIFVIISLLCATLLGVVGLAYWLLWLIIPKLAIFIFTFLAFTLSLTILVWISDTRNNNF